MEYPCGYFVDNVWKCGCGALNSPTRETCGKCAKPNPKNHE